MQSFHYQEIQPERDCTGSNFANGQINFNFTLDSSAYWNPYRSFVKLRCKLYKRSGNASVQLDSTDGVAPNMFLADHLWQALRFNINNQCVSEIGDYVPQIAALKHRMYKTEEELNNFYNTTNFAQSDITKRIKLVSPDDPGDIYKQYTIIEGFGTASKILDKRILGTDTNFGEQLDLGDNIIPLEGDYAGGRFKVQRIVTDTEVHVEDNANTWGANVGGLGDGKCLYNIEKVSEVTSATKNDSGYNRDIRNFEVIWRPPLGIFEIDNFIPGCQGLFNLQLTPQPDGIYQQMAVELTQSSTMKNVSPSSSSTGYVFEIESINMYMMKGVGAPTQNKSLALSFKEVRCQTQNLTTSSLHQKTFQVHPNSQELTLAYQYPGAGLETNKYSAAKFKCAELLGVSDELQLQRFWVRFGGKQLPTPIPDTAFDDVGAKKDFYTQRYIESLMYTNALRSPEPYEKWIERGPYFHFSGYGEHEKEDRVYVSQQFNGFVVPATQPNVLLFDHFVKTVSINIKDSLLHNVQVV